MEKFQIAKYGMMQVTAVVYGVLMCGVFFRLHEKLHDGVLPLANGMYRAAQFSHYGMWLFLIVFGWTFTVTYLSSHYSAWEYDTDNLAMSGLVVAILLAMLSSYFVGGAFASLFASSV